MLGREEEPPSRDRTDSKVPPAISTTNGHPGILSGIIHTGREIMQSIIRRKHDVESAEGNHLTGQPAESSETFPLIREDAEGYHALQGYAFPVWAKKGTKATYVEKFGREKVYIHPTEPYEKKQAFLERNHIGDMRNILTVLGANWPVFYVEMTKGKSCISAIDQNRSQADFLDAFLQDEKALLRFMKTRGIEFLFSEGTPHFPDIISRKIKGQVHPEWRFDENDPRNALFRLRRTEMKQVVADGRFSVVIGDLEDVPQDMDLNGVDFIDLSNVPEIIGVQKTQNIVDAFPDGSRFYMAFLSHDAEKFLHQLTGCRVLDREKAPQASGRMRVDMALCERTRQSPDSALISY